MRKAAYGAVRQISINHNRKQESNGLHFFDAIKDRELKFSKFKNLSEALRHSGGVAKSDNIGAAFKADKAKDRILSGMKLSKFEGRLDEIRSNIKCGKLDKSIFEFAQNGVSELKRSSEGTFRVDDFKNTDAFKENVKKVVIPRDPLSPDVSRYDAYVIGELFDKESVVSENYVREFCSDKFKDPNRAATEMNARLSRLDVLSEHGFFEKMDDTYRCTQSFIDKCEEVLEGFEFSTYDSGVMVDILERYNGLASEKNITEYLSEDLNNPADVIKDREYILRRFERNIKAGYMKREGDSIHLTDKGQGALSSIYAQQELLYLEMFEKKLDFYSGIGLLNDRENGVFEVTRHFAVNYIEKIVRDQKMNTILDLNEVQNLIIEMSDKKGTAEELYNRIVSVSGNLSKDVFDSSLRELKEYFYLYEKNDVLSLSRKAYDVLNLRRLEVMKDTFEFGFGDLRLFRLMDEHGCVNEAIIRESLTDSKYLYPTLKRLSNIELIGWVERTPNGYIPTQSGIKAYDKFNEKLKVESIEKKVAKLRDNFRIGKVEQRIFEIGMDKSISVEELINDKTLMSSLPKKLFGEYAADRDADVFVFDKFDSNTVFNYFDKDTNAVSVDSLKTSILEKYVDEKEAERHFKKIETRLVKLIENEYVSFDKDASLYTITPKGIDARNTISKEFRFTSYDVNVLFDYINRSGGALSQSDLYKILDNEYSAKNLGFQIKYNTDRLNENLKRGYLDLDDAGRWVVTDKGRDLAYSRASEYLSKKLEFMTDIELLDKFDVDGITRFSLNDNFRAVHADRSTFKFSTLDKFIFKHADPSGYFNPELIKSEIISKYPGVKVEDVIKNAAKVPKPNELQNLIYDQMKNSQFDLLSLMKNETLLQAVPSDLFEVIKPKSAFNFGKYDANTVMRLFDKNSNSITLDELRSKLEKRYNSDFEVQKNFKSISSRINKLNDHGYLDHKDGVYTITEMGLDAQKRISNEFEFTSYDSNVIFGFVRSSDGKLTDEKLLDILSKKYTQNDLGFQMDYHLKRIENNISEGYLQRDDLGVISISDKGYLQGYGRVANYLENNINELLNNGLVDSNEGLLSFSKLFEEIYTNENTKDSLSDELKLNIKKARQELNKVEGRIRKLHTNGYIKKDGDGYSIIKNPMKFEPEKKHRLSFKADHYDYIKHIFLNGQLKSSDLNKVIRLVYGVSGNSLSNTKHYLIKEFDVMMRMNLIEFDEKTQVYSVTSKGVKEYNQFLKARTTSLDKEYVKSILDRAVISRKQIDSHIIPAHGFASNMPHKSKFVEHFSIKRGVKDTINHSDTVISRDIHDDTRLILEKDYGRTIGYDSLGNPTNILRVVMQDNGFVITAFPVQESIREKVLDHTVNINKFDIDNILSTSFNNHWYVERYQSYMKAANLPDKSRSVEKRLVSLSKNGYAERVENGIYKLTSKFLDRCESKRIIDARGYTERQEQVLSDISKFLNLTDSQIENFFYKESSDLMKYEIGNLVNRGLVESQVRDLRNDGEFSRVYYMTAKGKKEFEKINGNSTDRIFSSKIHNKPDELRHDILVYSAFKHKEAELLNEGYKITKIMTDKDMRSYDMRVEGSQRIEYSDLYIEYTSIGGDGDSSYVNLEVDCGYKRGVIAGKAKNISNLSWYTDSQKQANKIMDVYKQLSMETPSIITICR
jgi:DNA-binding PadR family transcriptional regulator